MLSKGKYFIVEAMRRVRVKSRALYLFICCIFVTSVLLLVTNNPRPSIHSLVTETQKQLINLKENFKEEKKLKVDKLYLHFLGLSDESDGAKHDAVKKDVGNTAASQEATSARTVMSLASLANVTDPVIVSAVFSGDTNQAIHFLKNIFFFRPDSTVILFEMDLGSSELEFLLGHCNGSMNSSLLRIHLNISATSATPSASTFQKSRATSSVSDDKPKSVIGEEPAKGWCYVIPFDPMDIFPSFVRNKAYRPLAIQQVHRYVGCCLIWLELDQRLTTGNLDNLLNATRVNGGVSTWLRENTMPTTSLTHPKMFDYLVTSSKMEDYNFQHMISLKAIVLFTTPRVIHDLMLPWIQCSLIEDCIEPIGAQASGCRFDKKPQFRYSGCHRYDVSALNIILGQMFNFDESKYISDFEFFSKASKNQEREEDEEKRKKEEREKNETLLLATQTSKQTEIILTS